MNTNGCKINAICREQLLHRGELGKICQNWRQPQQLKTCTGTDIHNVFHVLCLDARVLPCLALTEWGIHPQKGPEHLAPPLKPSHGIHPHNPDLFQHHTKAHPPKAFTHRTSLNVQHPAEAHLLKAFTSRTTLNAQHPTHSKHSPTEQTPTFSTLLKPTHSKYSPTEQTPTFSTLLKPTH